MNTLKNISLLFIAALFFASCSKDDNEETIPAMANIEITNVEDGQMFTLNEEATITATLYIPNGEFSNSKLVFKATEGEETIIVDLVGKNPNIAGEKTVYLSATVAPKAPGTYQLHAQFDYSGDDAQSIIISDELNVASGAFLPEE
ncbi:cupredoxin domain-containing protein [Flammeovirga pacifica]|uniref:DUF4625 domain-containing protein n=1 Tax=Flammeovirga pacifica TaxID=915059 RepID=A0A1S1Z4R8_FLAPC|nr:hypothetical protein [Flammeovirga pacifica]OHX68284.1 hypothetical protein NH26_18995 [Flammeovirga pacifica]